MHNNRLEHMIQVMGYHPQYLESFLKTQQYLLRGDGPLPYDYRHYIAIMVRCEPYKICMFNFSISERLEIEADVTKWSDIPNDGIT